MVERGQWSQSWTVRVHPAKLSQDSLVGHVSDEIEDAKASVSAPPQRSSRRLSDKILVAFHQACDQADYEVASRLLQVLEVMLSRRPTSLDATRRRSMESLVAAHERLWHLRHPNAGVE